MRKWLVFFFLLPVLLFAQKDSALHFSFHACKINNADAASLNSLNSILNGFDLKLSQVNQHDTSWIVFRNDSTFILFNCASYCCPEPSASVKKVHDSLIVSHVTYAQDYACDDFCPYLFVYGFASKDVSVKTLFVQSRNKIMVSMVHYRSGGVIRPNKPPQAYSPATPVYVHEGKPVSCWDCKQYQNGKVIVAGQFRNDTLITGRQYIWKGDTIIQIRVFKDKQYVGDGPVYNDAPYTTVNHVVNDPPFQKLVEDYCNYSEANKGLIHSKEVNYNCGVSILSKVTRENYCFCRVDRGEIKEWKVILGFDSLQTDSLYKVLIATADKRDSMFLQYHRLPARDSAKNYYECASRLFPCRDYPKIKLAFLCSYFPRQHNYIPSQDGPLVFGSACDTSGYERQNSDSLYDGWMKMGRIQPMTAQGATWGYIYCYHANKIKPWAKEPKELMLYYDKMIIEQKFTQQF